jgi:transcriptional regulator with XRE-family HTH domain
MKDLLRLKEVLSEKGVTGKELAEAVGVTPASISNIAQNNSFPKASLLISIADFLNVDVRELFRGKKGSSQPYGFIEFKEKVFKITSANDLEELVNVVKNESK